MSLDPLLWVAGGRDFSDGAAIHEALLPYHGWTLITGAARGCDLLAEKIWREMERPYVGVPARWAKWGKGAGPIRNELIATIFRPHRLVAFPGGSGTADAIRRARDSRIEVVVVGQHV